ncbi:MAG: hypothetical protein ABSC46_07055 [Candidatus Limnocylindrales bacterium]|jgi:hypothetical protein
MGSLRKAHGRFGAAVLLLVVAAACNSAGPTSAVPAGSATGRSGGLFPAGSPAASGIHVIVPESSGAGASQPVGSGAPRATAAAVTVDQITADYTYKSELITPIAHLYGLFLDDFVIVTVKNGNAAAVKIVVSSEISGYTSKASDTVTVPAGATQEVRQNPRLTTAAIDGLNSQHEADLHVVVSYLEAGQPRTVVDQTSPTLITSRRDFPWSIKGFTQEEDWNLVVAMVTPTDPGVEELIRAGANYDPNGAMVSNYDSLNDESGTVWQRLSDIWQAETNDYSLTYIGTTDSFASGSSQRIRLPGEVLDQASGNCIELTLLYASVVEALGMQPAIVMVPGHAYIAVRVDAQNDNYYFIETTMIGQATFKQAVTTAVGEWQKAQPHLAAGEPDYGWVDIAAARADGIIPIPWR